MTIVCRIRAEEKRAAAREMESWQGDDLAEVEELVQELLEDRDKDELCIGRAFRRAHGRSRAEIDRINRLIKDMCDSSLRMHELTSQIIRFLGEAGTEIKGADRLEQATEDYRRWKEDYPDLLAVQDKAAGQKLRERVKEALRNPPTESNWREDFEEEERGVG